jgi:hypothetical protein
MSQFFARQDASGLNLFTDTLEAAEEWAASKCLKNEQVDIFELRHTGECPEGRWVWVCTQMTCHFGGD